MQAIIDVKQHLIKEPGMNVTRAEAKKDDPDRLRYSVSNVTQGKHVFYTLTIPSDVLARTCSVTTRKEAPTDGFQRELNEKRANEIAKYVDAGGTIPNSIVLSAQPEAELTIVGRGKTLEFNDRNGAFLILDGQHRVYGFSKAETQLRVPVVVYNNLTRKEESRLFIDINTKQKPVPTSLLLDIKQLAELEDEIETTLRQIFDSFHSDKNSSLSGLTAPFESEKFKITRVTFNHAVKPLLDIFPGRAAEDIYNVLNSYLAAVIHGLEKKSDEPIITKAVIFRAMLSLFPIIATRVQDRHGSDYSPENFAEIIEPMLSNVPKNKFEKPGTSWTGLRDYFESRIKRKLVI